MNLRILATALGWLSALGCLPAVGAEISPPNILLLLSDDHGRHLGCYGDRNARTPFLDRFAAEGLRFDRAYTAAPQCVPSRAALLSGRSPVAIAMTRFSAPLGKEVVILPDVLKPGGYFTGVVGRYYHLDGPMVPPPAMARQFAAESLATVRQRFDYVQVNHLDPDRSSLDVISEFLSRRGDRPFFLWVNFHEPHRRWKTATTFDPAKLRLPADLPDLPLVRQDLADYYEAVERLDKKVGAVLQLFAERQLTANTLVVFMGDNGCSLLRGKGTLYEKGCGVPLMVRWPGRIHPGRTNRELISGEDLTPTLIDAAGLAVPAAMTGRSFLPALRDQPHPARDEVCTARGSHGSGLPHSTIQFDQSRAITTRTHRLIYNALWTLPYSPVDVEDYGAPVWSELRRLHVRGELPEPFNRLFFARQRPMFELYDLARDPDELENLADRAEQAELMRALREKLAAWMIRERDYLPLPTGR